MSNYRENSCFSLFASRWNRLLTRTLFFPTFSVKNNSNIFSHTEGNAANTGSTPPQGYSLAKVFRECLLSFSFDFIGLLAGLVLAFQLDIFQFAQWIITIYPAILSAKGIVAGILSGRLGTALHVGTIYPRFIRNTKVFYRLFDLVVVITLVTSLFMSMVAILFGVLFWGVGVSSILEITLNVTATMALGLTISLLTIYVSFISFKRGLDPDVVVYPVMSSTADMMITIYYVAVVRIFFLPSSLGKIIVAVINILYLILVSFTILRNMHSKEFAKDIREILLTLIIVAFIVNVTGTFLGRISAIVEEKREVYAVYPAIIDMIGDVGSVLGSVSTTKLALGLISPSLRAIRKLKEYIFSAWIASLIIFASLSFISLALTGTVDVSSFAGFTLILSTANVIAVPIIIVISFFVSILTFKYGFDPDNFVIPLESSLADSVATIALLFSLIILYRF